MGLVLVKESLSCRHSLSNQCPALCRRHIIRSTQLAGNPGPVGTKIRAGTRYYVLMENLTNPVESRRVDAGGKAPIDDEERFTFIHQFDGGTPSILSETQKILPVNSDSEVLLSSHSLRCILGIETSFKVLHWHQLVGQKDGGDDDVGVGERGVTDLISLRPAGLNVDSSTTPTLFEVIPQRVQAEFWETDCQHRY